MNSNGSPQKQWEVSADGGLVGPLQHFALVTSESHALIGVFDSFSRASEFVDADGADGHGNPVIQTASIEQWQGTKLLSAAKRNAERRTWSKRVFRDPKPTTEQEGWTR